MDPTSSFFFHPFLPFPHFFFVLLYCNRLRSFREICDLFFFMSFGPVMIIRSQSPHLFPGLCYILFVYSAVFPFLLFTYYFLNLIYLYTNGRLFSIFNFIWKPIGRLSRTFLPFPISLWNDNCFLRYPSHFFVWCNTAFRLPYLTHLTLCLKFWRFPDFLIFDPWSHFLWMDPNLSGLCPSLLLLLTVFTCLSRKSFSNSHKRWIEQV